MSDNTQVPPLYTAKLLTIAFIVLKLCGVIDWSWWWVLSPIWIPMIFIFISLLIYPPDDLSDD